MVNRANLAFRFVLELAALAGIGTLTWSIAPEGWRIPLTILTIVAASAVWGTFNVPGDPSRSGKAPVPVPGIVRLALELLILFGGAAAFHFSGHSATAVTMAVLITAHYGLSARRIVWLLER